MRPKYFLALTAILFIFIFTGCGPKNMEISKNQDILNKPTNGNAKIVFIRQSLVGSDALSSIFLINNNIPKIIGIIGSRQKVVYELKPGKYLFMVSSEAADFMYAEVSKNKIYYVNVVPRYGFWKTRFSLDPKNANEFNYSIANKFTLLQANHKTFEWAQKNQTSIVEKYNSYYQKWLEKSESKRPKLYPHYGI